MNLNSDVVDEFLETLTLSETIDNKIYFRIGLLIYIEIRVKFPRYISGHTHTHKSHNTSKERLNAHGKKPEYPEKNP